MPGWTEPSPHRHCLGPRIESQALLAPLSPKPALLIPTGLWLARDPLPGYPYLVTGSLNCRQALPLGQLPCGWPAGWLWSSLFSAPSRCERRQELFLLGAGGAGTWQRAAVKGVNEGTGG